MANSIDDRNLLYVVVARRLGFITDGSLLAALSAWSDAREKPIGLILLERRDLTPEQHAAIEAEINRIFAPAEGNGHDTQAFDFSLVETLPISFADSVRRAAEADGGGPTLADEPRKPRDTVLQVSTLAEGESTPKRRLPIRLIAVDSRFRVISFHARGGLGQVSRAWDEQLGRQVALKEMLPAHADDAEARARFMLEAEINGNLEHPCIVPVYALGTFADGRPYYAMRFVEGETLYKSLARFHAEAAGLSATEWTLRLRRLLAHLLDVCDAIAYAHSRGVLHRDLKPSNILVGKFGETHIIDWGLAKATGRRDPTLGAGAADDDDTVHPSISGVAPTKAGSVFGSPAFMSPEQAAGKLEELDQTSDVYSLGATLYSVVTGLEPVTGKTTPEILEIVRKGAISPPLSVNPRVPPPLDAICREAMRLLPADRYPSVKALADDVRKWMADEPVSVFKDSSTTKALRWARHHRSLVASIVGLLFAAIVFFAVLAAVLNDKKNQIQHAQRDTEAALSQAQVAQILAETHARNGIRQFNELVTLGDRQLVNSNVPIERREQLLQSALHFIQAAREIARNDHSIQIGTAETARRLGHLYGLIGNFDQAEALFAASMGAFEDLGRVGKNSPQYRDMLASALLDLAELRITRGRIKDAYAASSRALEDARRNFNDFPTDPNHRRTLARAMFRHGLVQRKRGEKPAPDPNIEAAQLLEPLTKQGIDTLSDAVRQGQTHMLIDQLDWVSALLYQGEVLMLQGKPSEALAPFRAAAKRMSEIDERLKDLGVQDSVYYLALANTRLAEALLDDPATRENALALLNDAVSRLTTLTKESGDYLHFRFDLASALDDRARLHLESKRLTEAEADATNALAQAKKLNVQAPGVPDFLSLRGAVAETLGRIARAADRATESKSHFEESRRLQSEALKLNANDPLYIQRRESLERSAK